MIGGVRSLKVDEIRFLPIVVDKITTPAPSQDQTDKELVEDLQSLIKEVMELNFLPLVTENSLDKPPAENKLDGFSKSDFEVNFEKKIAPPEEFDDSKKVPHKHSVETPDFQLEDTPSEKISEVPTDEQINSRSQDVLSWVMANNQIRNIEVISEPLSDSTNIENSEILLPEPVYYDDHETYMMGLLDDLEELGDQREVVFLEELYMEETKNFIKERIENIILKFNQQTDVRAYNTGETLTTELPVFSVFADLFKTIDTQEKLILLDEVIVVGDEKEIEFLDGLLEDPNPKIRSKAHKILKQLIHKLSHENPTATYAYGVSEIVAQQIKDDEDLSDTLYNGLLEEMNLQPAVTHEMFDINFELCEVLDARYGQKILNLPVISSEILPGKNYSPFISQLRKFTKLFF